MPDDMPKPINWLSMTEAERNMHFIHLCQALVHNGEEKNACLGLVIQSQSDAETMSDELNDAIEALEEGEDGDLFDDDEPLPRDEE